MRGDVIELWPAYEEIGYRIELFGDEVERLATIDPLDRRRARDAPGDVRLSRPSTSSCPRNGSRGPSRASATSWKNGSRS